MKNIKFGMFALGLLAVMLAAISSVSAQGEARPSTRERRPSADVLSLTAGGLQLGVMVSDLDAKAASTGVKIDEVNAGSAAEKAGIKAGDVVVDYDGERVRSARQFARLVQETPEGRQVAIGLMRDGKKQTVNATPEAGRTAFNFGPEIDRAMREAERGFRFETPPNFESRREYRDGYPRRFDFRVAPDGVFRVPGSEFRISRGRLGVSVQSLTDDLAEYFGAKDGGALVSSVTPDSAAAKAGIKAGDVIVSINGKAVRETGDLMDALEEATGEVTLVVVRDKGERTLKATLSARQGAL